MVEHINSIKIEFVLRRIEEIFIKNLPVERVYRELWHYELIYEVYCQQKNSSFEFINLQSALENLVVDLYDRLQSKTRQKANRDCLDIFLQHCQVIERTFSPRKITTIQDLISKYSIWKEPSRDRDELRLYLQQIQELYDSWLQHQGELQENKLLLPEDTSNDLEIDRLLIEEIKQQRATIAQIENKSMEILNNFYRLVSPLSKFFPTYCSRNVFLEITEYPNDEKSNELFSIIFNKYLTRIAQSRWIMTDCDSDYLLELKGGFIYEELYPETGIYRSQKGQQVEVNIIPQPSLKEIPKIDCRDLKIKSTILNPGCGVRGYAFTILHKPTKITATIYDRHLSMYLAIKLIIAKIYSDRFNRNQKCHKFKSEINN